MTLSTLPNLASKLEELKLILDLRTRANPHTYLGQMIRNAIETKKLSNEQILRNVRDQAIESPYTMNMVIGQELTERILNYKK